MSVLSPPDAAGAGGGGGGGGGAPPPPAPAHRSAGQPDSQCPDHEPTGQADVVPVRARGVELLDELPGSGYRQPVGLVRRSDGQTVQLTRLLYLILEAIDGKRNVEEIAAVVTERAGRLVTADNVRLLSEAKLRPLGLLRQRDGSEPAVRKASPLLALRFRIVVSNPRLTRRITAPFAFLFYPPVVVAVVIAFVLSGGWVLFEKGLAGATYQAFDKPGLLLLVFAITVVSTGLHEFGHAAACRYGGATPGAMGMGLYLVWPAFYTNVDDSYRLGRAGRIRVDLGGLYFNAIVAVAMFAVWAVTDWDALLLVIAAQVLQMLRQLAPFARFDGYHILADLIGVPDLYSRIKPTLLSLLPTRWGRAESKVLKPWARLLVTVWVLVVVPLLLLSLVLIVVVLPRVAATAWHSLQKQTAVLSENWAAADFAAVGVRVLSIVAICLPVLAMAYLLIRVVRRLVRSVWRATAGRPMRRRAAMMVGLGCVAAITWAWWPHDGKYDPIQGNEPGTIPMLLVPNYEAIPPPENLPPVNPPPVNPPLVEGETRTAVTALPATVPPPTSDQPQLAVVMVPRSPGTATGTWVFPFNPPEAPGEGDNQALAVNTTDGATVYDVAFALVWVTDGEADNRNEAWAVASCDDCTTVSVAFQVVLIVGRAEVVIPENVAVAVNYSCVECVTVALASQLVVTLPNGLSEEARDRLSELWQEIEAFGQRIRSLSLQEIYDTLMEYKARILAIIREDAGVVPTVGPTNPPGTPPPGQSPSAPASPTGTTPETPTPTPSAPPVEPTPTGVAPSETPGGGAPSETPSEPTAPAETPAPTG